MGLRAEIRDGVSEISLVDGSILATPCPSLYERELGVEVTDAGIVETEVDEGWISGGMSGRGTVKSALGGPAGCADAAGSGSLIQPSRLEWSTAGAERTGMPI